MLVLHTGRVFNFETFCYIFIPFYTLLNKHLGSIIITTIFYIGFYLLWKNPPAQFFYDSKDIIKS